VDWELSELPVSRREKWRQSIQRFGARVRSALPFAWGVAAALLALWAYHALFPGPAPITTTDVATRVASAMASATPRPAFSSLVYQVIQPSIVLIQTKGSGPDGKSADGLGSGVIVSDSGAVLTALHVISDATDIELTFADGTKSSAVVANRQAQNDIAVLMPVTPPAQIVPATLGNPNTLRVGDEAYVVGNPLGLYSSMSAGVISGLNRTFTPPGSGRQMHGLIQIDAAVNPGNSGGPLLNRAGQVVGIVTALINPTEQDVFIGIGLAVPINTAASGAGLPPD
jgi:S1-C subfamily serine protease